jgi:RNA polymerase sigma-70 factor (ECF subfamily)
MRGLVELHVRYVARVLRSAGTPPSEVDDEVQRTFMIAAGRLAQIEAGKEKSFLFGIALNVAAHVRRGFARRRAFLRNQKPEGVEAETPEHLLDRKRMRDLIDRVLGQMQSRYRQVFVLHELEGMPLSQVAAALAIPRGTAVSRLRRARSEVHQRVADEVFR